MHINTQIAPSVSPRSSRNITSPLKQKLTKTEPQLPHKVGGLFFFTAAKLYFDSTHRLSCALNCPILVLFSGVFVKKNVTAQSTNKKIVTLSVYNTLHGYTDS